MVQRKAPQNSIPQPEKYRKNHIILEIQPAMKLERSVSMKPKLPNYMKPTKSWDTKKENVQVTASRQVSCFSNLNPLKSKKVRPLVKKSLKGVVFNRATCSSTLKDSKFPDYLDVDHGGTSVFRVCPYTYCSLNGHVHENLPPLKSFISCKRKLIKSQKSMKLKALSSFKIKGLGKIKDDTGQKGLDEVSCSLDFDDCFVEIYTSKPEENIIEEKIVEEILDEKIGDMVSKEDTEVDGLGSEDAEKNMIVCDFECKEEVDDTDTQDFLKEIIEGSNGISVIGNLSMDKNIVSKEVYEGDFISSHDEEPIVVKECVLDTLEGNGIMDSGEENFVTVDELDHVSEKQELGLSEGDEIDEKVENEKEDEDDGQMQKQANKLCEHQCETEEDNLDKLMSRLRITKKKITEESDYIRDFNPRSPNFLDIEPDPDAETVDLRHQTVDERKNSEEWMIDYALQRAVRKLGPARKRKVALLVEAFETVAPFEKPLHGRFIQACS